MLNALKKHLLPSSTYETTSDVHIATTPDPQIASNPQTQLESQLSAKKPGALTPQQQKAEQHKAKKKRNKQNRREKKQNGQQQDTDKRQQSQDGNVKPSDRKEKTHHEQQQDSKNRQQDSTVEIHSNRENKGQDEQQQDDEKQRKIPGDEKHSNRKEKKQNVPQESIQRRHQALDDEDSHAPELLTASRPEKDDCAKTLVKIKTGAVSEVNHVDESSEIAIKQKQGLDPGMAVDQNMAVSHNEVKTKMAGKLSLAPPSNNEARQVGGSLERLKQDIRSNSDLHDAQNTPTRWAHQAPVTAKRDAIMWKTFGSPRRAIAKSFEHSNSERTEHVCPDFPESLTTLGYEDLAYGSRAVILSQRAHLTLQDRLWRTVIFANYFHDIARPEVGLPLGFELMSPKRQILELHVQDSKQLGAGRPSPSHRAAVEEAVLKFLGRTERGSSQEIKAFTFANSKMASLLHAALREKAMVKRHELCEMFESSYRKPAYDLVVDLTGLGVLFGSEGDGGQQTLRPV